MAGVRVTVFFHESTGHRNHPAEVFNVIAPGGKSIAGNNFSSTVTAVGGRDDLHDGLAGVIVVGEQDNLELFPVDMPWLPIDHFIFRGLDKFDFLTLCHVNSPVQWPLATAMRPLYPIGQECQPIRPGIWKFFSVNASSVRVQGCC